MRGTGVLAIVRRTIIQLGSRPMYWMAMLIMPVGLFIFLTSMMEEGLPVKAPAGIVDRDRSAVSREITQTLAGMQMVDLVTSEESFSAAHEAMKRGEIFGFFFIPENFEQDLLAGRTPVISYYTNMVYYVPGTMLFKNFKTVAVYTKAGLVVQTLQLAGVGEEEAMAIVNPMNITSRGIGNPQLNYAIYLCNSFVPGVLQVMIFLVTCFSVLHEIKRATSVRWMQMAGGSVFKAVFAKLLPQTVWWWIIALFMEAWLFKFNHYPMHGSWLWLTVSELMYVLACQGFALFICCVIPNLRFALSICALLSILSFSISAYSFPVQSMYPAVGIFSWILPARYNLLIYIDQALNGKELYYSRIWYVAYIVFMLLPFPVLWNLRRRLLNPTYMP